MRDAQQLLIACHFGSISEAEIHEFIYSVTNSDEEYDSMIFDAYKHDVAVSRSNLELFLRKSLPDFELYSEDGILACRREIKHQIERLLRKECSQQEFCEFFNRLEFDLVINHDITIEFFGDLWNACDCFDESWQFMPSDYLEEEAMRVLATINLAESAAS